MHKQFPFPSPSENASYCSSAQGVFTSKESHPKALKSWRDASSAPFTVGEDVLSVGVLPWQVVIEQILSHEFFYDPGFAQIYIVWRALSKALKAYSLFFIVIIASNAEKLAVACLCYWHKAAQGFSKCIVFHLYIVGINSDWILCFTELQIRWMGNC